jgi:ribosomal protein S18 acetylase RimI-like enzyme
MKIRHADLHALERHAPGERRPWLDAACARLRDMPGEPASRILAAEEDGQIRAVLGMRLFWVGDGRAVRVVICVLEVDPEHDRRGIGSRLVRFAEGIARIHGCSRVDVQPDLEGWGDGWCWLGLGYDDPGPGLQKVLRPPGQR